MLLVAVCSLVVAATAATAYWSGVNHPVQGVGGASATSVNQGATPTVPPSGGSANVLVNWSASTLANGHAVDGYIVKRYDATTDAVQTTLAGCDGTITATSCTENSVPAGDWTYAVTPVIGTNWRGQESPKSAVVTPDTQAPTQSLSLTNPVGAFLTGTTLYYKGNAAGSFKLVDSVSDSGSGPASATFPAIATTGWTHGGETVTTPSGGPYASATFSWTANPSNPAGYAVSAADTANNTSSSELTFVNDTTAPAGGSVTYTDGVVNSLSVPVSTTNGTDGQSGIDAGTATVKRAQATLNTTTETCGAFGPFNTTVTLAGGADTSVTSGNCYQYQYLLSDRVGNQATYTSPSVAKVDTSGPRVTGITSQQSGGGAGNGQLQVGDKLILTFNQSLAAASVPGSFTGATETSPGLFQNVTLAIPGITDGPLGTGSAGYLLLPGTTASFAGNVVLSNGGTSTTVTITVTSVGGAATLASSGTLVFKPATTITDGGGNSAGGTFSTASNFKLF